MVWLKSCPRCRGDLMLVPLSEGNAVECVQCAHMLTPAEERGLNIPNPLPVPRKRSYRGIIPIPLKLPISVA